MPTTPDRYGHADAWWSPPAPPGCAEADRWAHEHRARFAAELLVEGESRRAERIEQATALLEAHAARYRDVDEALTIRTDGPGPGTHSVRLTPEQRQRLRAILVVRAAPPGEVS